ncbi:MAG: VWA domain-containing protein [Planctomycetota bacterium]|nr:VWA domain-containing protein [Planctomycetota bacterium]
MRFLYGRWDQQRERQEQLLKDLFKLFRQLLAKTAGDVEQALEWLDKIAERYGIWGEDLDLEKFKKLLEKDGEIAKDAKTGRVQLTPKGEKSLRHEALTEIFHNLDRGGLGEHRSRATGPGVERLPEVRPYAFGDDLFSISATDSLNNAVRRSMSAGEDEISVTEEDLAVYETEYSTGCATALLVDCSHSMVLYGEDRMTPARKVAMGLVELIQTRYPKDKLIVIAFGDDAVEVPLKEVPYLSYGPYHTNTKAALEMARKQLLRVRSPNRQIFLITDGKPTVLDEDGRRMLDSGPWLNPRIVNRTLEEGAQCRRKNIPITTFMVTDDPVLVKFVEDLTEINHGRAYYTGLGKLGQFLLVDYVRNRRRSVR